MSQVKQLPKIALYLLAIAVLAYHLPRLYDRIAFEPINRTHIFYSPVSKRFVYTETVAEYDPKASEKAEDHHSNIVYKDQDGVYYDRLEFERLLPFIYYRNMEIRGYMPIEIDGRTFDSEAIRGAREVMELNARNLDGRKAPETIWPLFEVDPGQAALVFPDDRCRFTDDELEFVNADYNRVDDELTARFSGALRDEGFLFPARHVAGKFTILKPFDDGAFLVDAEGKLYSLKRYHGEPQVERIPLPAGVVPRHIQTTDNDRYRAMVLDTKGGIYLLGRADNVLQRLDVEGYDADRMDFKIIFNPLYRTVTYSDETTIRAVAMDADFRTLSVYDHLMSCGVRTWKHELRDAIFPFRITMDAPETRMIAMRLQPSAYCFTLAPLVGLALLLPYARLRRIRLGSRTFWYIACLTVATGIYGLISAFFIEEPAPTEK